MVNQISDLKSWIREAAKQLGFDLCGIASAALPEPDRAQYLWWLEQGFQGEMKYMEREQRQDLRLLLPSVRSVICVGMIYNTPHPKSIECPDPTRGWISRYGWGEDYHSILHKRLEKLLEGLQGAAGSPFEAKVYVDTGPLLERAFARAAGLGWIAKNTCLISEKVGSWFFVGEILTSLELEPDKPVPDRCGTCRRCIDACPTAAIIEPYVLDATRCISYFTIEARGSVPEEFRPAIGRHVFGCDICQDVCPWNGKALVTLLPQFQPQPIGASGGATAGNSSLSVKGGTGEADRDASLERLPNSEQPLPQRPELLEPEPEKKDLQRSAVISTLNPPLEWLAALSQTEFHRFFRTSPVKRARYRGMLRNVAVAMGNSRRQQYRPALQKLAEYPDPIVQEHARWALGQLKQDQQQPDPPNPDRSETTAPGSELRLFARRVP